MTVTITSVTRPDLDHIRVLFDAPVMGRKRSPLYPWRRPQWKPHRALIQFGRSGDVRKVNVYGYEVDEEGHFDDLTSRTYWWSLGPVRLRPPEWVRTLVGDALIRTTQE